MAGAARSTPRPVGPTCRIDLANTGSSATAPPNSTASRSSRIAPSRIWVRPTNRSPSSTPSMLAGPGAVSSSIMAGSWPSSAPAPARGLIAAAHTAETRHTPAASRYTNVGDTAYRNPPSAGPITVPAWVAIDRRFIALCSSSGPTSVGGIARAAGNPRAIEVPASTASARYGHTSLTPAGADGGQRRRRRPHRSPAPRRRSAGEGTGRPAGRTAARTRTAG